MKLPGITPAPWSMHEGFVVGGPWPDGDVNDICDPFTAPLMDTGNEDMMEANAQAITALPKILEVLNRIYSSGMLQGSFFADAREALIAAGCTEERPPDAESPLDRILPPIHDPSVIEEGWEAIKKFLPHTRLVAFDGCHKIYMALDEEEAAYFRENWENYQEGIFEGSVEEMERRLRLWWEVSCPLRFISAVRRAPDGPESESLHHETSLFYDMISQFTRSWDDDDADD